MVVQFSSWNLEITTFRGRFLSRFLSIYFYLKETISCLYTLIFSENERKLAESVLRCSWFRISHLTNQKIILGAVFSINVLLSTVFRRRTILLNFVQLKHLSCIVTIRHIATVPHFRGFCFGCAVFATYLFFQIATFIIFSCSRRSCFSIWRVILKTPSGLKDGVASSAKSVRTEAIGLFQVPAV